MTYKVSVIIPTYNSENFLDKTINSVINQTIGFENIELIIVDDFSTDSTKNIIKKYCLKHENIKTYQLSEKTGTPGASRNLAIKNSNSEYLMFLDHDDCYMKDAVEKLYNATLNSFSDVAIGKFQTFGDGKIISEDWIQEDTTLNSIGENTLFFSINNIWRMIFPREFILKNNILFPEKVFAEDLTFMVDAFLNANKIVFINDIVYNFRLRQGEITSTSLSKGIHYLNGLIEGYDHTLNVLKKNNSCKYYDTIFNQHLSTLLSDLILSETISLKEKKELLKKSSYLFKNIKNIKPFPENEENKVLMENIKNDELDEVFKSIEESRSSKKIRSLESELENKKLQIADLQTTKGWFKYKAKNIIDRLKRKV
ncbi:MAG: glycosyltransferase family 2 protein [Methanobacteriaceae archaeon]|jgi:glycosyltransferase involved in cell wall biosynthesis|nr:glycosyltransferase family 2 protein [Methanobacteriaceae archaeon]